MPSIEKIHKILELLKINYRTGMTNKEISDQLKIPPSTCYRILASLRKYDYVYQRRPDMHYFLGFAHLRYAESVLESIDIAEICLPYLEELHNETEETTFFALWSGKHCVAMEICGHINTRVAVGRGEIMPLYCSAAGKAVLAFLPNTERQNLLKSLELYPHTSKTITDLEKLEKELEEIRRTGVSYNEQEFHNGINALATPIFGRQNRVLGSIVAVGISVDLDREQMEEYAELFLEASASISFRMGGEFPKNILDSHRTAL
ncbi:MAG: IclR family transcriptional regulator [Spirochaetota bacterium]